MDSSIVLVILAVLTLLVRFGQASLDLGNARAKNAASTIFRNIIDLCIGTLAFWIIGIRLILELNKRFGGDPSPSAPQFGTPVTTYMLYLVLALLTGGVVSGALSERSKLIASYVGSLLAIGILFPLGAHLAWFGWLSRIGFIDIGGAGVIHLSGAMFALAGAILVGPRSNKFNTDGSTNSIPGHWIAIVGLGTFLTLIGWVPYLAMATLLRDKLGTESAPINVMLAFAGGGAASLVLAQIRYGKPDVMMTISGAVGGLVAISAACGTVSGSEAILIGVVAGVLVQFGTTILDMRLRIDDPAGAITIHGIGGFWGLIAVAIFAPNAAGSRLQFIGTQLLGAVILSGIALAIGFIGFGVVKAIAGLRTQETDEFDGLDLAEHDVNAYPDFQQTMIKSYHLRET